MKSTTRAHNNPTVQKFYDFHPVLNLMKTLYPNIDIERSEFKMELSTTVRKAHEGKYYSFGCWQQTFFKKPNDPEEIINAINLFHSKVYRIIIYGKINTAATWANNDPVFPFDPDQTPEDERLRIIDKKIEWEKYNK